MTIYEDLRPKKQAVIDYIESTWSEPLHYSTPSQDTFSPEKMGRLKRLCKELPVDQDKLMALLKSQIMSGNIRGAVKVVQGTQDQKFNNWGKLLVAPIMVPINLVLMALAAPVLLVRWIARNA